MHGAREGFDYNELHSAILIFSVVLLNLRFLLILSHTLLDMQSHYKFLYIFQLKVIFFKTFFKELKIILKTPLTLSNVF